MTIYEIMKHIRNFFPIPEDAVEGVITITDGQVQGMGDGFVLIEGSRFNDGVFELPEFSLHDETFTGRITPLAPPADFLELCREIIDWQNENGTKTTGPFQSESFGGYSYTRATDNNGLAIGWQDVFSKRLNVWRKI